MTDVETKEVPPENPPGQNKSQKFEIRMDGEVIHTTDIDPRLVTGVRLHSVSGEVGVAGIPFSGEGNYWVSLTLDVQQPTSLPVVEDDARLKAQEEGPAEVMTFNPVAVRAEQDLTMNPDGSQDVPEGAPLGTAPDAGTKSEEKSEEKPKAKSSK